MAESKEKYKEFNQVDFNLAINYMVIKRVITCMSIKETIYEDEVIEYIIERAEKGKLRSLFEEYDCWFHLFGGDSLNKAKMEENKQITTDLFNKLHGAFGLSAEVLFGKRQIKLDIEVDQTKPSAIKLAYSNHREVSEYLDESCDEQEDEEDIIYIQLSGDEAAILNKSINNGIGYFKSSDTVVANNYDPPQHIAGEKRRRFITLGNVIKQLQCNPVGINSAGLYVYMIESRKKSDINYDLVKMDAEEHDTLNEALWDTIFKSVETEEYVDKYTKKGHSETFQAKWKNNIYSIDSIIFHILGYKELLPIGFYRVGEPKHQVLEKPTEGKRKKVESSLLPDPLVINEETSELLGLIEHIVTLNPFAPKHTEIVYITSVNEEIAYWEDKLPELESQLVYLWNNSNLEYFLSKEEMSNNHSADKYEQIEKLIAEIENDYLPSLKAIKLIPEAERIDWMDNYYSELSKKRQELENQILRIEDTISRCEAILPFFSSKYVNEFMDRLQHEISKITSRISNINKCSSELKKTTKQKDGKAKRKVRTSKEGKEEIFNPMILVKEPYYKYVPTNDYDIDEENK